MPRPDDSFAVGAVRAGVHMLPGLAADPNCTEGNYGDEVVCAYYQPPSTARFLCITSAAAVALLGALGNGLIAYVFSIPSVKFSVNPFYLVWLAFLDIGLCLVYVLLFGAEAAALYLRVHVLYDALFGYTLSVFLASRVIQFMIPIMLILASFERFLIIAQCAGGVRVFLRPGVRVFLCVSTTLLMLIIRLPMLLIYRVTEVPCPDPFRRYMTVIANECYMWYENYEQSTTWVQIFAPFVLLVIINATIVFLLWQSRKERLQSLYQANAAGLPQITYMLANSLPGPVAKTIRAQLRQDKRQVRSAITTMAIIVSTYLICNFYHATLIIIEKTPALKPLVETTVLITLNETTGEVAKELVWTDLYIYCSDLLNFLFVFCSCIRPVIYYCCNIEVKREVLLLYSKAAKVCATHCESCFILLHPSGARRRHTAGADGRPGPGAPVHPVVNVQQRHQDTVVSWQQENGCAQTNLLLNRNKCLSVDDVIHVSMRRRAASAAAFVSQNSMPANGRPALSHAAGMAGVVSPTSTHGSDESDGTATLHKCRRNDQSIAPVDSPRMPSKPPTFPLERLL